MAFYISVGCYNCVFGSNDTCLSFIRIGRTAKKTATGKSTGESSLSGAQQPRVGGGLRFLNATAQQKYENDISKRVAIKEQGIQVPLAGVPEIKLTIHNRGWELFTSTPTDAVIPVVHEFYSNFDHYSSTRVYVRGKDVDVSANEINGVLKVNRVRNDEWFDTRNANVELQQITSVLCDGDMEWTYTTDGTVA
ncbi:hypothetical protein ACH5RR_039244 [Cinchona calisaya]|uniref:Putative plant transposon protein domain-containing protein n=1 Tax=Cinchona calisaya TaxID=153742 RepID=A0ABD2XXN4_9GENT